MHSAYHRKKSPFFYHSAGTVTLYRNYVRAVYLLATMILLNLSSRLSALWYKPS